MGAFNSTKKERIYFDRWDIYGDVRRWRYNNNGDYNGEVKKFENKSLKIPMEPLRCLSPEFASEIKKISILPSKLYCNIEFLLHIIHGVRLQIDGGDTIEILELASEYKLWNVKKYCEQLFIIREFNNITDGRKINIAMEHDLNLLMSQMLIHINSCNELTNFMKENKRVDRMNGKMMKLMIQKMYKIK